MKTPIKLIFEGKQVATITNYTYETPWASGNVEFTNKEFFIKLVNVTSMLSFDAEIESLGISEEEEDKLWEAKLSELNISEEDLDLDLSEEKKWRMEPFEGKKQKIYALRFYEGSYMEWRL